MSEHDNLHLSWAAVDGELLPNLDEWKKELEKRDLNPLLWFVFGSVVKTINYEEESDELQLLVREMMGVRGRSNSFRDTSDIDIGVIVPDGQDMIGMELAALYDDNSIFRTRFVDGHPLSMTRFTDAWLERRGQTLASFSEPDFSLGFYGPTYLVDLERS